MWGLLIIVLSIMPVSNLSPNSFYDFVEFDKLVHLFLYSIFTFLLMTGLSKQFTYPKLRYNRTLYALLIAVIYGLAMEGLQELFFVERFFEMSDVIANLLGTFVGGAVFKIVYLNL